MVENLEQKSQSGKITIGWEELKIGNKIEIKKDYKEEILDILETSEEQFIIITRDETKKRKGDQYSYKDGSINSYITSKIKEEDCILPFISKGNEYHDIWIEVVK